MIKNLRPISKMLLISIFVFMIYSPSIMVLLGPKSEISKSEKRRLASFPQFEIDKKSLKEFPSKFEAYFNDHFGFRNILITLNNYLYSNFIDKSRSSNFIIGKEKWVFSTLNRLIEDYRGLILLNPIQLNTWKENLELKNNWLAEQGIRYLFVVAPNKQTIYPEYMPEYLNKINPDKTQLNQLVEYLNAHSQIKIVDLRSPLLKAKKNDFLYFQGDTHWNSNGTFVAYQKILERLSKWFPEEQAQDYQKKDISITNIKIASAYPISMKIKKSNLSDEALNWRIPSFKLNASCARNLDIFKSNNKKNCHDDFFQSYQPFAKGCENSNLRAIVIHDSMITDIEPFLSEHFRFIEYIHRFLIWIPGQEPTLEQLIRELQPDVIIEEKVERMLFDGDSLDAFHIRHGFSFLESGEFHKAIIQFNEVIRLNPASFKAHYLLGIAFENQNKLYEAKKHYNESLRINDEFAEAHTNLGTVLLRLDEIKEAIEHYRYSLKLKPDLNPAKDKLQEALTIQQAIDSSIKKYQEALKDNPNNFSHHYQLGNLYKRKGALNNATSQYKKALSIQPESFHVLNSLASAYIAQKKYREAISILKKMIALQPENSTLFYNISCLYAKQNNINQSLKWLKYAIDKGYNNYEMIKTDKDLDCIKNTPYYKALINRTLKNDS